MLYFRFIVKAEELEKYLKDTTYSKIEIRPREDRSLRDFRLKCYLPSLGIQKLKNIEYLIHFHSKNTSLPNKVREILGGYFYVFKIGQSIGVHDLKELRSIEKEYKIKLSIPKEYDIYLSPS